MSKKLASSIKNRFNEQCGHFTYDRVLELTTWWIVIESNNFKSNELEWKISDALSIIVFKETLTADTVKMNWNGVEYDRKQTRSELLQILITATSQLKSRNERYLVYDDRKPAAAGQHIRMWIPQNLKTRTQTRKRTSERSLRNFESQTRTPADVGGQ